MRCNKRGFTLVELLVVALIISIISGVIVINFRKTEQINKLQRSGQQIVQSIRKAQSMALFSTEYQGKVYDYYGVHFDKDDMPNSYYIFVSSNKTYNNGEETETLSLEKSIIIDALTPNQNDELDIFFAPPYAFVDFDPGFVATQSFAVITVKKEGGTCPQDCRYIKINDKGWMAIQRTP